MGDTITFVLGNDVKIIENNDEIILRKGFIHNSEIIIDKKGSSSDFLKSFKDLFKTKKISVVKNDKIFYDFEKLFRLGMLQIETKKNILLLIPSPYLMSFGEMFKKVKIKDLDSFLTYEDSKKIVENKDVVGITNIIDKIKIELKEFDRIYYVNDFSNFTRNRAFSRIMFNIEKDYVMGLYDNDNIFMFGVQNSITGCYECLERSILTKFSGRIEDYEQDQNEQYFIDKYSLSIIVGFLGNDILSVDLFGLSYLTGNVLHIFVPNYEFSFDANRRSPFCPNCAGINNLLLEEEKIRAINILQNTRKEN